MAFTCGAAEAPAQQIAAIAAIVAMVRMVASPQGVWPGNVDRFAALQKRRGRRQVI
jgi:hypothetical protein